MRYIKLLNVIKPKIGFITFLTILLTQVSCKSKSQNFPYDVGKSYYYEISIIETGKVLVVDTLVLEVKNKGFFGSIFGMNMALWTSKLDSTYKETRGINLSENAVEIQTPTKLNYLNFEDIVIADYPRYSAIMKVGYTSESEHDFLKGYGKLSGKTLKQSSKVLDSSLCSYKNENLNCKVTESKNDNYIDELGSYYLKTHYNELYGFVLLQYIYPSDKTIIFKLIDIKTNN